MRKLTSSQRSFLERNPNVEKTTESHVVFKADFKKNAVRLYGEGMDPKDIFDEAGLKLDFFIGEYYRENIKRWRDILSRSGSLEVKSERRGRPKAKISKNVKIDRLSNEDLRALVRIQAEVIEELKKMKALAKKK